MDRAVDEQVDQAQWPFDRATRLKHAQGAHEAHVIQRPLVDRLRQQLRTLPIVSPLNLVILATGLLASLHLVGLLLFTRGFLLTRQALADVNDCEPLGADGHLDPSCSLPPTHTKLVLIVIDALRADFVLPVDALHVAANPQASFYANHFRLPAELTSADPTRSFLFHFIADAPTTTLQRLKGLTTGSLPTFVDAGSNFAGERITEDNWLAQAKRHGKRLAMVGDDTWLHVFPRQEAGMIHDTDGPSQTSTSVWREDSVWPYDSFNVEDLDTVDRGVAQHLLPLLEGQRGEWDIAIAHLLGLDHAGHRFGPWHGETRRKLQEAQLLLEQVVSRLDNDTLLVVLGDHGMTDRGDHGGDSREELNAALWVYSKGPALAHTDWFKQSTTSGKHPIAKLFNSSSSSSTNVALDDRMHLDWPSKGLAASTRSVAQVDLVPTLSLLLGLPVPFGNLGLPIPELFYHASSLPAVESSRPADKPKRGLFATGARNAPARREYETLSPLSTLLQSTVITSSQLSHYLAAYTSRPSGRDLVRAMPELHLKLALAKSTFRGAYGPGRARAELELQALERFSSYERTARERARRVWARFEPPLMGSGLLVLLLSVVAAGALYRVTSLGSGARSTLGRGVEGAAVTAWAAVALHLLGATSLLRGHSRLGALFLVACGSAIPLIFSLRTVGRKLWSGVGLAPTLIHATIFASNSFTVFEDAILRFLLSTSIILSIIRGFAAPDIRLRRRTHIFNAVALVGVQAMAYSTVCRDEQSPFCGVTFYPASGSWVALLALVIALVATCSLPTLLRRCLARSNSDVALGPLFLAVPVRGVLLLVGAYWLIEWCIAGLAFSERQLALASSFKTGFARAAQLGAVLSASVLWYLTPLCIRVRTESSFYDGSNKTQRRVEIMGFANALGATYVLLCAACLTLLLLVSQPVGQIVLVLHVIVLLSLLESFDAERDIRHLTSTVVDEASLEALLSDQLPRSASNDGLDLTQLSMLSLLAHLSFFATGHQATFASIQWSVAFIGFPLVTYPFSPALVVLNTLAPHLLTAIFVPLYALWNVPPSLKGQPPLSLPRQLLRCVAGYLACESAVAFSSAAFAALFRRHLFVWKVFAPRFMLSAIVLLGIDSAVLLVGLAWGVRGVMAKARSSLGTRLTD